MEEVEAIKINRLILIGNGFDLAHGFKTGYKDFIFNYFKKILENFYNEEEKYKDELFGLSYKGSRKYNLNNTKIEIKNFDEIKKRIDSLQKDGFCEVKFHSKLFEKLFNKIHQLNWVDIENEYFELLVNLNQDKIYAKNKIDNSIKKLNSEFNFLKKKLESYLTSLKIDQIKFTDSSFTTTFLQEIRKEDIVTLRLDYEQDIFLNDIYFLSFNYTNTLKKYLTHVENHSKEKLEYNFIHGELNNNENPIIFGFGDELDEKYRSFENQKNNDLFTHIKSFKYSQTSNYHDLIRFIESGIFQVFVIGHSCGLSDRTMLNEIFEHTNCKSIKIFFHKKDDNTDDFTEKCYEISRHFKDKGLMRKRLVPKNKSSHLPKPIKFKN